MTTHHEANESVTLPFANGQDRTRTISRSPAEMRREFDRNDPRLAADPQPPEFEAQLVAFMRSPALDMARRMRAASRLLVDAAATARPTLAVLVYHDLLRLAPSATDARAAHNQALLLYHGPFGSRSDTLRLANEIIVSANKEPHSMLWLEARVTAVHALQLVADSSELVAQLEKCYAHLVTSGARARCDLIASRLASVRLDEGEVGTARSWTRKVASFVGQSSPAYLTVKIDLALLEGDFAAARRFISTMRSTSAFKEGGHYAMTLLIYSLRLAQCEQTTVDDTDTERLMHWHLRARSFGHHDDAMECLWVALVNQRRLTLASDLLIEYLTHYRRETRPCKYSLLIRTAGDPAWRHFRPNGDVRAENTASSVRWNGMSMM